MENEDREENNARREAYQNRIATMSKLSIDSANAADSPQRIIMTAIKNKYQDLDYEQTKKMAQEVVKPSGNVKVEVRGQEVSIEDLQFVLANSIEVINSETNTQNEYFSWIEKGHHIIRNMNDGEITREDLRERNDFLVDLDQREAELMVCIGLYQNSGTKEAKARSEELHNKLQKLREIRSAIQVTTREKADNEKAVSKEEYTKALAYWLTVGEIQKAIHENNGGKEEQARDKLRAQLGRENLGEQDKRALELEPYGNEFEDEVRRYRTFMEREVLHGSRSPSEYMILSRNPHTSQKSIGEYINSLRGRKTVAMELAEQRERIEKQKEIFEKMKQNGFDSLRYLRLDEQQRQRA